MKTTFEISLKELQPTQLYICSEKLAAAVRLLGDGHRPDIDPVPVKRLGSRLVLTDGHTRAFAAFQAGLMTIAVFWETDELDWEAYEVCVQWCLEEGIRSIADLRNRIVPAQEYEEVWYKRRREMRGMLAVRRRGM